MSAERQKSLEDFLNEGHTPMMAQYHTTKAAYPDCLLFYRMGDFYELFYEDAVTAAAVLDITLTKRGKNQGDDIPMCGVPWHSHEGYLAKLIKAGYKVAICEQTESPEQAKKRGGHKALVKREVVRVITGGTLTEDHLLSAREHNYLAAIAEQNGAIGLAWAELSTGAFWTQSTTPEGLSAALERINPGEILISEPLLSQEPGEEIKSLFSQSLTAERASFFEPRHTEKRLKEFYELDALDPLGPLSLAELNAAGALVGYLERTQIGQVPYLSKPQQLARAGFLEIDAATRRNLELSRTISGERQGSLLHSIDRTVSGAGARMLSEWLAAPLCNVTQITERQDKVALFATDFDLCEQVRAHLKVTPDIERALARITGQRGGPRDLEMIREGLRAAEDLRMFLSESTTHLSDFTARLSLPTEVQNLLETLLEALQDAPPVLARDGKFIRTGYDQALDRLRALTTNGREQIAKLQYKYQQLTHIDRLKISFNNVLGYFVEVPSKHAEPLLGANDNNPFIHRQTMANAVRFTTTELSELERDLTSAADKSLALEMEIFYDLCTRVSAASADIAHIANTLACIDTLSALGFLAGEQDYIRPAVTDSLAYHIQGGRHPVVEQALKAEQKPFVPNNCSLDPDRRLWLLTGPNMAGKSTFLRQNALIAIMAQMGSFVPAEAAEIGLVDRIFSRVGASDDLARGRSTFMVEMVETAAILNRATERSLVILDEIGRGTATFDGLSIAWACVEHLHDTTRCRALFATHYHELTHLQASLPRLSCHSLQVKEWKGDIIFLHSVAEGAADRSYGIHVAKLAGLPAEVLGRAQQVLTLLQQTDRGAALSQDMPLFNVPAAPSETAPPSHPLEDALSEMEPDHMTPREALDELYRLKKLETS